VRILFIGDVFAKPGRRAVRALLPSIWTEYAPDIVIANVENIAGGAGVTRETCEEMFALGIVALTTGNHVWDRREAIPYLETNPPVLRPLNYPEGTPGRGWLYLPHHDLLLVNLQGRVFMRSLDDPFRSIDALLASQRARFTLVDFHAVATAEKKAMGFYLDGRVSAVIGTHTHVPTADAQILPHGTGFISDVGMVGPYCSIIGNDPASTLQRYLTYMPTRIDIAKGPVEFNAVLLYLDDRTGMTCRIEPIHRMWPA
jgi:metallophosphoesterase (TIGR00282 family)